MVTWIIINSRPEITRISVAIIPPSVSDAIELKCRVEAINLLQIGNNIIKSKC